MNMCFKDQGFPNKYYFSHYVRFFTFYISRITLSSKQTRCGRRSSTLQPISLLITSSSSFVQFHRRRQTILTFAVKDGKEKFSHRNEFNYDSLRHEFKCFSNLYVQYGSHINDILINNIDKRRKIIIITFVSATINSKALIIK